MFKRFLLSCLIIPALAGGAAAADLEVRPSSFIQDLIDVAEPGSEIVVPPGIYNGTVAIRDTIVLRGAGESDTIIDGQAAPEVVTFGKESALIGFTVRNGSALAVNKGNFIGIFECTFDTFASRAISFEGGSGVVANNFIRGRGTGIGIYCFAANPVIINNMIESCGIGFQWGGPMIPALVGNLFRGNDMAINGQPGSNIVLERNLFDGNREVYNLGALPDGNEIRTVSADEFVMPRGTETSVYRDLMDHSYESAVKDHPIIVYDLHQEPGVFDAITLFPWATFTVSASAVDTKIEDYEAYDWVADRALNAEYLEQADKRPSVRVNNPEIREKMRERFVLENRYVHPASYFDTEDGHRVFRRMTNLAQIEIVIPEGFRVVSFSPDAIQYSNPAGRPYLSMQDIGDTHIEVVLERMSAP